MSPFPTAANPSTTDLAEQPQVEAAEAPAEFSASEQETIDTLYTELKPMAVEAYLSYFAARTPVAYQEAMKAKVAADLETPPMPEDAYVAHVGNGDTVVVKDAAGIEIVGSPGTATVVDRVLTHLSLQT